jgi:hypothetical protein
MASLSSILVSFDVAKGKTSVRRQEINGARGKFLIALSVMALLAMLAVYLPPPQPDEGSAAHIFHLSLAALLPISFLATRNGGRLDEGCSHWPFRPPPCFWLFDPCTILSIIHDLRHSCEFKLIVSV